MLSVMTFHPLHRVAVIGSGMSGATCAQALTLAGHDVQVFDKARGPGGRLATRRMAWEDAGRRAWTTRLDHGALGITARTRAFRAWVDMGVQAGWLTGWTPTLAAGGRGLDGIVSGHLPVHLPVPDLPQVCRQMLEGSQTRWSSPIEALHRSADGWQLQVAGERLETTFDAVVLALPPAQAAPLLAPHRVDWSLQAGRLEMQPCWTLMGVEAVDGLDAGAAAVTSAPRWDLAAPSDGPLAWVLRQDARPGRPQVAGQAHWVAHARVDWSRDNLERSPDAVRDQLAQALAEVLGRTPLWHHLTVHRWRYALPPQPAMFTRGCWWDGALGLGVCGDFLGGEGLDAGDGLSSAGVESAWLSGRALARQLLSHDLGVPRALAEAWT